MQIIPLEDIIKVQPKGVITIPKKFRQAVNITDNTLVRIKTEKGRLVIEPVRTLPYPVRHYTDQEVDEFFRLDNEETQNSL